MLSPVGNELWYGDVPVTLKAVATDPDGKTSLHEYVYGEQLPPAAREESPSAPLPEQAPAPVREAKPKPVEKKNQVKN